MKKKILSIFLSLAMIFAMMPAMGSAAYAASYDVSVMLPDGGGTFVIQDPEVVSEEDTDWGTDGTQTWMYVAEDVDNSGLE